MYKFNDVVDAIEQNNLPQLKKDLCRTAFFIL